MTKQEELYELCKTEKLDKKRILELIEEVNLDEIIEPENTTLLNVALTYENLEIFKILLKNGANPNFFTEFDGPVLWDLKYRNYYDMNENEQLNLVKFVLDCGANPNISWDGETLMENVLWEVFNEIGENNWEYIIKFFVYLIAYGGKLANGMPVIYQTIDKNKLNEYEFFFVEDGRRGEITRNGERVAYI